MSRTSNLLAGLAAGAFIGAVAGLLLAPKPGRETRKMVGTKAQEIGGKAGEVVGTVKERIRRGRGAETVEEPSGNGVQTYT